MQLDVALIGFLAEQLLGGDLRDTHNELDRAKGIYYLLRGWGHDEAVCNAGLIQPLYRDRDLSPGHGETLRRLAGGDADRLAQAYRQAWSPAGLDFRGRAEELPPMDRSRLADMRVAECLEPCPDFPRSRAHLERAWALHRSLRELLGGATRAHLERRFLGSRASGAPPGRERSTFTFAELIAPVSMATFQKKHWTKAPLHIPGDPERFRRLFGWDDVNHFLSHHRHDHDGAPRLRIFGPGYDDLDVLEAVPVRERGIVRAERKLSGAYLLDLLAHGANLQIFSAGELSARLQQLTADMSRVFQRQVHSHAFAAFSSSEQGFAMHYDFEHNFVVQLDGTKDWTLYEPIEPNPVATPDTKRRQAAMLAAQRNPALAPQADRDLVRRILSRPVWTGRLRPGDVLYVPGGWIHRVVPTRRRSLHLSLPLASRSGLDLLADVANHELAPGTAFSRDVPITADNDSDTFVAALRQTLVEHLDDGVLRRFSERQRAKLTTPARLRLPRNAEPVVLSPAHSLRFEWILDGPLQLQLDEQTDTLALHVHGRDLDLEGDASSVRELVRLLHEQGAATSDELLSRARDLDLTQTELLDHLGDLIQHEVVAATPLTTKGPST